MNHSWIASVFASVVLLVAIGLLIERGGLLAWLFLFIGACYQFKIWWKPSTNDKWIAAGLAVGFALTWLATWYYVISTYESGEVVELSIETNTGQRAVRLWVMDGSDEPVVYYDAEPAIAGSLLAGKPLQFARGGVTDIRIPNARLADDLPEDEAGRLFGAMSEKYTHRMSAVDIYYVLLGRPRDRVALVVRLSVAPVPDLRPSNR